MIKLLRRFLRFRSGLWWTLPVAVVLAIMTLTHNALLRFDPTTDNIRQWEFGGHTQAVHFNTLVPTTEKEFKLDSVLESFSPGLSERSCNELMSLLSKYSENQTYFAYKEYSGTCTSKDWGFTLVSGRLPKVPGEVVATIDTGFLVNDKIVGLTPKPLTVVGHVFNKNADTAKVLIGHPGTFRSFGWPDTKNTWPNLTSIAVSTFDGFDQSQLENYFRNLDPNVAFDYLNYPRKPLLEKSPYLYLWTVFPLFLAAILFSFTLRNAYTRKRESLLISQGSSSLKATVVLLLANSTHLLVIGFIATLTGSVLALLLEGPIRFMSSRELGPFPIPYDPLIKFCISLLLGFLIVLLATLFTRSFRRFSIWSKRLNLSKGLTTLIAASFLVAAVAALNAPLFQLSYFAFVLLITLGIAFVSHRFLKWVAGRRQTNDLATELARRRISSNSFRAGLAFTGSVLATAPVLTFLLMFSSALAQSNSQAVALPDKNQVTYDIFQPSQNDKVIENMALKAAGANGKVNSFSLLKTTSGVPVVATPDRLGAVLVVDSVDTLEEMLQTKLTFQASNALRNGGILWFSTAGSKQLWTLAIGSSPANPIEFESSASLRVPLPWSNQAKAVILSSSLESHGLQRDTSTVVVTGISNQEANGLADALLAAGLDPSLVRYHKEGDAYSETPLQLGIVTMMGLLGMALMSSSTRAMISSLRAQARELISLGVPASWMSRVFFYEFRSTLGLGALTGLGLTALASGLAFTKFNLPPSIPWVTLLSYATVLSVALVILVWSGFRKIRG